MSVESLPLELTSVIANVIYTTAPLKEVVITVQSEDNVVETTTLIDDATTEYPSYEDEEDDQINSSLAKSLLWGR